MASRNLDKFYTTPATVALCYQELGSLDAYTLLVEPSAGNGAFLEQVPQTQTQALEIKAYDIAPTASTHPIETVDYLTLSPSTIKGNHQRVITLGNPPFGRNSSLCLRFLKQAALYSDTIAFILPKGFKKASTQDKVPLTHSLVKSIDLPSNSFTLDDKVYDVPCVFQIWQRTDTPRVKRIARTTTPLFTFVSQEQAELSVRRVGVYAGKAYREVDKSAQSHYFLKLTHPLTVDQFLTACNAIEWEHNNITGPRSISKGELIEKMEAVLVI